MLSRLLIQQHAEVILASIDYDADEDYWLIHFQVADPRMVTSMHEAAMDEILSPSGLYGFDADDRIKEWLRRIEVRLNVALSGSPQIIPAIRNWFGC